MTGGAEDGASRPFGETICWHPSASRAHRRQHAAPQQQHSNTTPHSTTGHHQSTSSHKTTRDNDQSRAPRVVRRACVVGDFNTITVTHHPSLGPAGLSPHSTTDDDDDGTFCSAHCPASTLRFIPPLFYSSTVQNSTVRTCIARAGHTTVERLVSCSLLALPTNDHFFAVKMNYSTW